ncbi:hypothetical protein CSA56_17230 [candidate division KSB3 bacterium]|uniref:site-specific DNA-methyltransferase (adenine-specific) n=1 Tax=candidate division KSB3 bacterium TaxID=2044937 RepID=A0A2G6K852_9BACT|nr:MAG: hypothetical protein CSA56_17230 [candidate division KSB3 bacterium]
MTNHLRAVAKECRELLERDFAEQSLQCSTDWIKETSLSFFLAFAGIRCAEERIWNRPVSNCSLDHYSPDYLHTAHHLLQTALSRFFIQPQPTLLCPSSSTLETLTQHFLGTILSETWQSDHILGWLYQYFEEGLPDQKQHGRFYTPEPIAEYIVTQAFELFRDSHSGELPLSLSVLDLACGSGMFALYAFERLYEHHQTQQDIEPQDAIRQVIEQGLFLIDNDPWACRMAALNLYLKAKCLEPNCQIDRIHLHHGDALQRWEKHEQHSPLKELFSRKFDIVIGNPPYIVINQLHCPKEQIRLYKTYRSAAFKINTFALFIERGIELLKPGGILGMIVPNTFLTQIYFEPLRTYILDTSAIHKILDTKRLFDNAFVENCIILLQRQPDTASRRSQIVECLARPIDKTRREIKKNKPYHEFAEVSIPQCHFEKAPLTMFNVHLDEATFRLMEKIASDNPKLGDLCESHDGVNPGNAKHKLILSEPVDETCKKVLNGKNIGRYCLKWGGLYVCYNRDVLSKGDNVRWGHRASLDAPKILTRQTADRLLGTFDNGEYYTTNSIHTTVLQKGVQQEFFLKYILALLNSKVLSFYYRKLISEAGQVFSQVKLINLRQIPIKHIPLQEQKNFVETVDCLLKKRKQLSANSENGTFREHCRTRERDDRLDAQIYALFELSHAEIHHIEAEMGKAVCLFPRVSIDVLQKEISLEYFREQYTIQSKNIFHMAEYYEIHPESLFELQQLYNANANNIMASE